MNDSNRTQPFGARQALPPGATSFGGRKRLDEVLALLGTLDSENSVSVSGPRQSGKSSLLQQLSDASALQPYPSLTGALVVQADFRDFRGRAASAIQYLIDTIAAKLDEEAVPGGAAVRKSGTMVTAVRNALHALGGRRLIIAIDDFEYVGSDLKKDEQADLRNAVYKQPNAGYVVASRLALSRCLEEFGDPLSDFAPSCVRLPRLLGPLGVRDIQHMIERALPTMPAETRHAAAKVVHDRVGGFACWVQQALALAVRHIPDSDGRLLERQFEDELFERLQDDFALGYRRLSARTQRYIEESAIGDGLDGEDQLELEISGWTTPGSPTFKPSGNLVERWIRSGAWERQPVRAAAVESDPYERLVRAVELVNRRHQRATGRASEFVIRPDVFFSSSDIAFLRRETQCEEDLGRKVLVLARLLYEGSGGATKGRLRLPQWCYDDPGSIVYQVTRLRHAFVHLENPNASEASRDLQAEAQVYRRYVGVLDPSSLDQYKKLGEALIEEAIFQLECMRDYCPFVPDLKLGALIAESRGGSGAKD